MLPVLALAFLTLAADPNAPTGLAGKPGALLAPVDPKTLAFEVELLGKLNLQRQSESKAPLVMDERLRVFARRTAESAAKGEPGAKKTDDAVKQQGLAPFGYRVQFSFGPNAEGVWKELQKDKAAMAAIGGDFGRAGVGGFWVPVEQPYFQVMLFLATEPDPQGGKPGLSPEQTNPVMAAAAERLKQQCYDPALADNPNLKGEALFQLVIVADGKVGTAKLLRPLGSPYFDDCSVRLVSELTFPKPYKGKPVTLNHPVRFTPPQGERIIGKLTPQQLQTTMGKAMSGIRKCYDEARKDNPKLAGRLILGLVIESTGELRSVQIKEDDLKVVAMNDCILKRVHELQFPRPKYEGPVETDFPLELSAR